MDGNEDVLRVQTYFVDAEVPLLCGKQMLESWNFKIDRQEKVLYIQMKTAEDHGKKFIKMEDTTGEHYGITRKTKQEKNKSLFLMEEDTGILFWEYKEGYLCSSNQEVKCLS